jgi:hypothetical protein
MLSERLEHAVDSDLTLKTQPSRLGPRHGVRATGKVTARVTVKTLTPQK